MGELLKLTHAINLFTESMKYSIKTGEDKAVSVENTTLSLN